MKARVTNFYNVALELRDVEIEPTAFPRAEKITEVVLDSLCSHEDFIL